MSSLGYWLLLQELQAQRGVFGLPARRSALKLQMSGGKCPGFWLAFIARGKREVKREVKTGGMEGEGSDLSIPSPQHTSLY